MGFWPKCNNFDAQIGGFERKMSFPDTWLISLDYITYAELLVMFIGIWDCVLFKT